ncbi:hypothetical protein [uncultured Alistipes sp.]|uniref:hypothetical protein n=1 Tax=uncultured Alistipes sp. TaxID=538949 RepID=UPI003209057C
MRRFLTAPYLFKIQFSMLQLCLGGTMRVRLNLNEYELHRNSLQIVTPGSIGQCLDFSPDFQIVLIAFPNDYILTEENSEGALIVWKFLARRSLLELTDAQTSEMLVIFRALLDKLRQPDFRFKHDILKGYLQVLYGEICQLMPRSSRSRMPGRVRARDRFSTVSSRSCGSTMPRNAALVSMPSGCA